MHALSWTKSAFRFHLQDLFVCIAVGDESQGPCQLAIVGQEKIVQDLGPRWSEHSLVFNVLIFSRGFIIQLLGVNIVGFELIGPNIFFPSRVFGPF